MAYLVQTPFLHCSLLRKREKKRTYYLLPNELTPISKGNTPFHHLPHPKIFVLRKLTPRLQRKENKGQRSD
jgi:hypothetical protein